MCLYDYHENRKEEEEEQLLAAAAVLGRAVHVLFFSAGLLSRYDRRRATERRAVCVHAWLYTPGMEVLHAVVATVCIGVNHDDVPLLSLSSSSLLWIPVAILYNQEEMDEIERDSVVPPFDADAPMGGLTSSQ